MRCSAPVLLRRRTHAVQCSRLWASLATRLAGLEIPRPARNDTHRQVSEQEHMRCSAPVTRAEQLRDQSNF
jgi:hypothetical protein